MPVTHLVWRQPFPGPGLAIRILCLDRPFIEDSFAVTNQILQYILHPEIAIEESLRVDIEVTLATLGFWDLRLDTRSLHATLLPIRTVGVQGDGRSYRYAVGLSGTSQGWETVFLLAKMITQLCHNVNRVVWIFGDEVKGPLTTITPTYLSLANIRQLQQADAIVNDILFRDKLIANISQMPVILTPVDFGISGCRSIALRPFCTNDFMTGVPAIPDIQLPMSSLEEMVKRIVTEVKGITRVMYDVTSKPPGTTEWE